MQTSLINKTAVRAHANELGFNVASSAYQEIERCVRDLVSVAALEATMERRPRKTIKDRDVRAIEIKLPDPK